MSGSRVRDRRDQSPGAAGPVIRGLVNGGPQLRWQPGIAAGILGGHPVGEERGSADRLKLVGVEHGSPGRCLRLPLLVGFYELW